MAKKARLSTSKPAPRKRDREATKNKLLKAGLEVFSKIGFDAATTLVVAKKAGVNEALISRYFEGKSGLLAEIIIAFIKEAEQSNEYPSGQTLEEEIRNFMIFHFELDLKNRDFLRVAIARAAVDPKLRKEVDKHFPVDGNPLFAERLEVFKKNGDISADTDLMHFSRLVCNQALGFMFTTCMIGVIKNEDIYKMIDVSAKLFAIGIKPQ